jgi:hypothetical protein
MDEQEQSETPAAVEPARRGYTTPSLTEYGSVAKLTQSNGSTTIEGSVVAMQKMCL